MTDVRHNDVPTSSAPATGLKRNLQNRHIQMIALGGAIGTGLFYGSASSAQIAGPAVLLAYAIGGAAIFLIMRALGEMSVHPPGLGDVQLRRQRELGSVRRVLLGLELLVQRHFLSALDKGHRVVDEADVVEKH